jgi:hypothetical protein
MTIELTEHILFDLTTEGKPVSLEILDASDEISKLFNRIVTKEEIKQLLCDIVPEPRNEYLIRFKSPQKNEIASFLIPIYKSPIL